MAKNNGKKKLTKGSGGGTTSDVKSALGGGGGTTLNFEAAIAGGGPTTVSLRPEHIFGGSGTTFILKKPRTVKKVQVIPDKGKLRLVLCES